MQKYNKILVCLLLPLVVLMPKPVIAEPIEIPRVLTVEETIHKYSQIYNIDENMFLSVAKCESKLNPNAINYNDGGIGKHSVGVLQYQESTFYYWASVLGEQLDYYSYNDQIKLGAYMFSKGQGNQWTCYRKIKTP